MKKSLLAAAGVAIIGGALGLSYYNAEEKELSPESVVQSASASESEKPAETAEQVTPPTERTVDTSGEHPWNFFEAEFLKAEIKDGGQAYLMSDAEALEKQALGFLGNPVGDPENIVENYVGFGNHLNNFVADLSEYYLMDADYFNKLSEAATALINNDPETATVKLQEAQALRTQ